jgi:hypothetical protein
MYVIWLLILTQDISFANGLWWGKINYHLCVFQVHRIMLRYLSISLVKCYQGNVVRTASYSSQAPKVAVVCIAFITFFKWYFARIVELWVATARLKYLNCFRDLLCGYKKVGFEVTSSSCTTLMDYLKNACTAVHPYRTGNLLLSLVFHGMHCNHYLQNEREVEGRCCAMGWRLGGGGYYLIGTGAADGNKWCVLNSEVIFYNKNHCISSASKLHTNYSQQ